MSKANIYKKPPKEIKSIYGKECSMKSECLTAPNEVLSIEHFGVNKASHDGRNACCRTCQRERQLKSEKKRLVADGMFNTDERDNWLM